jgi:polyketide biosynthesis acyl carrier protein
MDKENIIALIGEHTVAVLPDLAGHAFSAADRLSELGANSVDRAEILMMVLESLSLSIPRVELFGPKNIGELAEFLAGKLQAA